MPFARTAARKAFESSAALSCRRRREALLKNLLESGPEHCIGPPFSARRILVCANDGTIDD